MKLYITNGNKMVGLCDDGDLFFLSVTDVGYHKSIDIDEDFVEMIHKITAKYIEEKQPEVWNEEQD